MRFFPFVIVAVIGSVVLDQLAALPKGFEAVDMFFWLFLILIAQMTYVIADTLTDIKADLEKVRLNTTQ